MLEEELENSKKGHLIVFEGIESSGKSTQAELLSNFLREKLQQEVILTKEPSNTDIGLKIREIIFNESPCSLTELFLFLADRSQHIKEIINPALEEGKVVICDRFSLSTLCYQSPITPISTLELMKLDKRARSELISSINFTQLVLYLSVDKAFDRISKRNKDAIEKRNHYYFERVNEQFKLNHDMVYFNKAKSYLIDADRDSDTIHKEIKGII